MAQLEKLIKVTQEQYNTLQAGGTVGSHTGINPNFIYLVENNGSSEGGTVVEANPSDDATDVLTKLKVGETVYSTSNQVDIPEFDSVPETFDETTPALFRVGMDLYYTYINTINGYLTFSSDSSFGLIVNSHVEYDGSLEYSTDTASWTEVSKGTYIWSVNNKIYLRGTGNTYCRTYDNNYGAFRFNGSSIKCEGNIETLLDYQTVLDGEHPTMAESCYRGLFRGCSSLIQAPELPATTLSADCYR